MNDGGLLRSIGFLLIAVAIVLSSIGVYLARRIDSKAKGEGRPKKPRVPPTLAIADLALIGLIVLALLSR